MDRETAQNSIYSSVAKNSGIVSESCRGAAIESSYYAFEAAADYGPTEVANVMEYAQGQTAERCALVEIEPAMDEVRSAVELGSGF